VGNRKNIGGLEMKTIAVGNFKGGVGKTTTAGHLGYLLSNQGKTCFIDGDPQGNLTSWYLTEKYKYELSDVLRGDITVDKALVNIKDNLYILPTRNQEGTLRNYAAVKINDEPFIFRDLADELQSLKFNYIVMDLSPGLNRLETALLTAADEVIIPITLESFSVDGLTSFLYEFEKLKKNHRLNIKINCIIANNVNQGYKMHLEALEILKDVLYDVYIIPQDMEIKKAQDNNKPIFTFNQGARSIDSYKLLTAGVM